MLRKSWPGFDEIPPVKVTRHAVEAWRDKLAANGTGHKPARVLVEKLAIKRIPTSHVESGPLFGITSAKKALKNACDALKLPRLTHHDLRDAFATTCIEGGVDIPTVAAWLGHADGGALLMKVDAHHRMPHSLAQATKVNFGEK